MSALQVDVARAQMQFRAALPHVHRFFAHLQDNRAAWAQVLDDLCRNPRKPSEWRATADCLAPLVLTYLGIMDNSADIERHFSVLELIEGKRAVDHHTQQHLQDILKIRLHAPSALLCESVGVFDQGPKKFLEQCQKAYREFFGTKRFMSRDPAPISMELKLQLLAKVRPRWAMVTGPRAGDAKGRKMRRAIWEESAQELLKDVVGTEVHEKLFAFSAPEDSEALPGHVKNKLKRRLQDDEAVFYREEDESQLAMPPRAVRWKTLMKDPSKNKNQKADVRAKARVGIKRKSKTSSGKKVSGARSVPPRAKTSGGKMSSGARSVSPSAGRWWMHLPSDLKVSLSEEVKRKHRKTVQRISKRVTLLEENRAGDAQWRVALKSHDPASHVFAAQGGLTTWKTFIDELITMVSKAAASSAPLPVGPALKKVATSGLAVDAICGESSGVALVDIAPAIGSVF